MISFTCCLSFCKLRRLVFSFYVWNRTLADLKDYVLVWGSVEIAINAMSAILAVLGMIGTIKRNPVLAHLYFFAVGSYLCYWAARIVTTAMFADAFTLSNGDAWKLTIVASSLCLFLLALVCCFLAFDINTVKKEAQQVFSILFTSGTKIQTSTRCLEILENIPR